MTRPAALELHDITKRYASVVACDSVSLCVAPGTIHALGGGERRRQDHPHAHRLGARAPRRGRVQIGGAVLGRGGAAAAGALGLGMVHQHFMLVPTLSRWPRTWPWGASRSGRGGSTGARRSRASPQRRRASDWPWIRARGCGDLSVGEQQRVEIVKVLSAGARVLVLDEPTAVLTPQEVEDLFRILRDLARDGHSVVLISHRLTEVLELAGIDHRDARRARGGRDASGGGQRGGARRHDRRAAAAPTAASGRRARRVRRSCVWRGCPPPAAGAPCTR